MPKPYVENFFNNGELRLSSFFQFREHIDEQLKDEMEGKHMIIAHHQPSKSHVTGVVSSGHHSYVLCGTTQNTIDNIKHFGGDAAIQIFDTTSFGIEIGRQIPSLRKGVEGFCIYNDGPIELLLPDHLSTNEIFLEGEKHHDKDDLSHLTCGMETPQTNAVYFKKSSIFQKESEYRWIWVTEIREDKEIFIKCPNARMFCKPIYLAWLGLQPRYLCFLASH